MILFKNYIKKISFVLFLSLALSAYGFDLNSYWSLGDAKLGGIFQAQKPKAAWDINISAFKFYFKDLDSGFNLSLSPFQYFKFYIRHFWTQSFYRYSCCRSCHNLKVSNKYRLGVCNYKRNISLRRKKISFKIKTFKCKNRIQIHRQ